MNLEEHRDKRLTGKVKRGRVVTVVCRTMSKKRSSRCLRTTKMETRCSAIAEIPRCRVRYSLGQRWKTGTGRQYFTGH